MIRQMDLDFSCEQSLILGGSPGLNSRQATFGPISAPTHAKVM